MALAEFDTEVGGNFMFARQSMVLLELASRVAGNKPALLRAFTVELERIDRFYFMPLPGDPGRWPHDFDLPYSEHQGPRCSQLLPVLFDLVRHGQSHYGQQIPVLLADGNYLGVSLGGVTSGATLDSLRRTDGSRRIDHLCFRKRQAGHFELWLCPGTLFLDLREAAERSRIFPPEATLKPFRREWKITSTELEEAILREGAILWEEDGELVTP